MKEKLKELSDSQLIQVATELRQSNVPNDALVRMLIPQDGQFVLSIIEITAELAQVLADRLAMKII